MARTIRSIQPKPDVKGGIDYWQSVPATVDGVLGGYGLGTLPRVDALGSRLFLLDVLPRLAAIPPSTEDAGTWTKKRIVERGGKGKTVTRALDCGAGVGRVTENVLSKIVDEVHLVEPVRKFLVEAARLAPTWPALVHPPSKTAFEARKSVHFHVSTLHALDPCRPWSTADGGFYIDANGDAKALKRPRRSSSSSKKSWELEEDNQTQKPIAPVYSPLDETLPADTPTAGPSSEPLEYDIVCCQWMLQHLSDPDLKSFFARAKKSLKADGIIFVKENVCAENEDGSENVWWDEEDKSITRSANGYERIFAEAGLNIVRREVQEGLPAELFVVKMWALR